MANLQVDSVSKSFGERQLLQNVHLACKTGEVVGILGRNGTGKSTLFQIIFGTTLAQYSYVGVDHKVLRKQKDRASKIAYLPQHDFLPSFVKIRKLINLFCDQKNQKLLVEIPDVKPFLEETCSTLSGGERRWIETLLILYSDSQFVMLDEPFSGLLPIKIEAMKLHILGQKENKGIILSDHNYQQIMAVSDRILLLESRNLKPIEGIKDLQRLKYLY